MGRKKDMASSSVQKRGSCTERTSSFTRKTWEGTVRRLASLCNSQCRSAQKGGPRECRLASAQAPATNPTKGKYIRNVLHRSERGSSLLSLLADTCLSTGWSNACTKRPAANGEWSYRCRAARGPSSAHCV